MNFDYFTVQTVMANIDIDDIGNCAIEANNDNGEFWYLIIRTTLGSTQVFEYGPTIHTGLMEKTVNCSFKRIEFTEAKVIKRIKEFLNNPYKNITQAKEMTIEEALEQCDDMLIYMKENTF